ncbi:hypothetical protein GUJ93_ZPchr0003g17114 [Zizania palustris]|uniref:Uncharacterized protein n=1 Tax=Zizania palustris TaxID=103762 RepID=A0A8J5S9U4_ZIZPA|nr:hypothetical protein GUJ93_ZPchr0003g17114 [Zizania palustris]
MAGVGVEGAAAVDVVAGGGGAKDCRRSGVEALETASTVVGNWGTCYFGSISRFYFSIFAAKPVLLDSIQHQGFLLETIQEDLFLVFFC